MTGGRTIVSVAEIADASGLGSVSVGKFCRSAGFERVGDSRWKMSLGSSH